MTNDPTGELPDDVLALLADEAVWHEVDPAVEERAIAAVLAEVAATPIEATSDTGPSAPPVTVATPVDELAARRQPRGAWMLAAAAAALLALVGVVGLVNSRSGDDADIEVALAPTELAPTASAVARITDAPSGTRIVLSVSGLDPAPAGTYYEAWLRTGPDVGVSAGTFHLRGGDGEIELWSGVSTADYPLLTVTLQPEGMVESSGDVVLAVRLDE